MPFGRRLRTIRAFRKISQQELERRTGIDQKVLSQLECGHVLPTDHLRQRIHDALGWDDDVAEALKTLESTAAPSP
ncbi:hypothetical protein ES703_47019 [subsurface metagenome]